jgi:hypothetical protein
MKIALSYMQPVQRYLFTLRSNSILYCCYILIVYLKYYFYHTFLDQNCQPINQKFGLKKLFT